MRRAMRALPIIILAVAAAGVVLFVAVRQRTTPDLRYFGETDTVVREPFLTYFEENGGIAVFGFPLSDAYTREDGTRVQTFQRMQLQLTVRGVEPAPIGLELALGALDPGVAVNPAFRALYTERGGVDFFGQPIAEARLEAGALVQDFENARLVVDALGETRLANLGSAYAAAFPPPAEFGQAALRLVGTPPAVDLEASVSVEQPTLGSSEQQTLYLYVTDNAGNPVQGVNALAVLRYDNAAAEIEMLPTDAHGLTQATFIGPPASPGSTVLVEMHVLYGEVFFTVPTTYIQWW